jgi:hypothetical protein
MQYTVSARNRFAQVVRDQDDVEALRFPQVAQRAPQLLAGEGVQRAEGLVQQQHLGLVHQRAADAGALLHAARQLPGKLVLHSRPGPRWPAGRGPGLVFLALAVLELAAVGLDDLQRQQHVVQRGAPGQQAGAWKAMPEIFSGPVTGCTVDGDLPLLGIFRPVVSFMKVDLPQPDGPTMAMNSPFVTFRLMSSTANCFGRAGRRCRPARPARSRRRVGVASEGAGIVLHEKFRGCRCQLAMGLQGRRFHFFSAGGSTFSSAAEGQQRCRSRRRGGVDAGLGAIGVGHLRGHQRQAARVDAAEALGACIGAGHHGVDGQRRRRFSRPTLMMPSRALTYSMAGAGLAITSLAPLAKALRKALTASGSRRSAWGWR